jgi:hypothetical protein
MAWVDSFHFISCISSRGSPSSQPPMAHYSLTSPRRQRRRPGPLVLLLLQAVTAAGSLSCRLPLPLRSVRMIRQRRRRCAVAAAHKRSGRRRSSLRLQLLHQSNGGACKGSSQAAQFACRKEACRASDTKDLLVVRQAAQHHTQANQPGIQNEKGGGGVHTYPTRVVEAKSARGGSPKSLLRCRRQSGVCPLCFAVCGGVGEWVNVVVCGNDTAVVVFLRNRGAFKSSEAELERADGRARR